MSFAAPSSVVFEGLGTAEVNQAGSITTQGMTFDLASALAGLLLGTAAGAVIGTLWYLPGYGQTTAAVLLTAVGGLAGLVTAAVVGARTHLVVTDKAVSADHGAPPGVLVAGLALGLAVTALALWGVWRPVRRQQEGGAA
jgi:hypothetical protein